MEMTLGKRIIHHRKRLSLTQDQLAEKLGVTAQAVSKWENDQSCPDITMLPRLAEIFGISVDALLGVENVPVHEAEVVQESEENNTNSIHVNNGKWEFRWDAGRRGALGCAIWVMLLGALLLVDNILGMEIGFWNLAWPSFVLIGGLFCGNKFSFFRLGCVLLGGYFLLANLNLLPFTLESDMIWPILVILFGISLLADALKKPKKPTVRYRTSSGDQHHEKVSRCDVCDDHFSCENIFGQERYSVAVDLLRSGEIEGNFGSTTVDLSGVAAVAEGCHVDVESNFGEIKILVPKKYCVKLSPETAFGSVSTEGAPDETAAGTISMTCEANFGSVKICYI
ncbi:MAG: helix-turn-helix domain-containing protein [Oscillospiraceae bacterium]|nr:helix-turn-helix domain-containing protein [Oscillospiraceae bacterium]